MEVDHVTYIFGSFSRRRPCDDVTSVKRRSVDQMSSPVIPSPSSRSRKDENSFLCSLCQRQFIEPRVLPCLHTFCTSCLLELDSAQADAWSADTQSDTDIAGLQFDSSLHGQSGCSQSSTASGGSGGSGYESAARSGSDVGWPRQRRRDAAKRLLTCPTCGAENKMPCGGVAALPPHYVLQHRIVLASINKETTRLLCDLCSTDMPANSRCTDCLLSLCHFCAEAHGRQRVTSGHEVLPLTEARMRGIASVRRQAMCPSHPEQELRLFCVPCRAVTCRDCCLMTHRGHACETVQRAALSFTCNVRDALHKAKPVAEQASQGLSRLHQLSNRIEARCNQVQEEVDHFIDSYVAAVEEHRRMLQLQVLEARETKLHALHEQRIDLERRADDSTTAVRFAEDLLAEGSDVELLSFVSPLLERLEKCCGGPHGFLEPRVSECVQFLPEENAGARRPHTLFGVVTTQTVSPLHSVLNTEGLLNCRQHKKAEAVLMTRDSDEQPLCHGGEKVTAELRYRDASHRRIAIHVTDLRNGSYLLTFVPDASGNLSLSVSIHGKPIQGSPFSVCVRTLRQHHGTFHCCSFCSSGGAKEATCGCGGSMPGKSKSISRGAKEATCGCGGSMPGGYRGCGHGHEGHPGRRHWSCCGNLLENSECGGRTNSGAYQFTL